MYDIYRETGTPNHVTGLWGYFESKTSELEGGFFHIAMNIAVYASGIAILLSAAYLALAARQGAEKLKDAKGRVMKVLIVSILIFSVTGFMSLIQTFGLDF